MKRAIWLYTTLAIVALMPLMAHAQFEYQHAFLWTQVGGMEDLGTLPGWPNSIAVAISDSGEVVGSQSNNTSALNAIRWTSNAGMQHLPGASTTYSGALAVNNSGDVAGVYYPTGTTSTHGFIWTQAGGFQDIGSLGGTFTTVTAINRSGEVVGYAETSSGAMHGFLWTQSGGMQDIGTFMPWAVNDNGLMAGSQTTTLGQQTAAVWNRGRVTLLCPGLAQAVNNSGQVAGEKFTPHTDQQAFLWTPGGVGLQLLPMLPGAIASFAQGVNKSGEVAGWSLTTSGNYQAFIWTSADGTQDIGNLGGNYGAQAFAINDSGQVVGSSTIQ